MSVSASEIQSDIDQWQEVAFPTLSTSVNLSATEYSMHVGVFGYDMSEKLDSCTDNCSNYDNYDGWSQGAHMVFEFYQGFTSYQNFGACFADGNCWGAWLQYDSGSGDFYSTEITFKYEGTLSTAAPNMPSSPDWQYYEFYENNMYSFYDGAVQYIWYYLD